MMQQPALTSPDEACRSASPMAKPKGSGLPPKSPSSMTVGRLMEAVPRRRRKHRGSRRGRKSNRDETTDRSSSNTNKRNGKISSRQRHKSLPPPLKLTQNRSLCDPAPDHMKISGSADDFFSTPDLNNVTFDSKPSPRSVVLEETYSSSTRPLRRSTSWSGNDAVNNDSNGDSAAAPIAFTKACINSIFRRQKVMSADVASVGNASDTLVMVGETGGNISGRELHERAKEVLNAGDYDEAIRMFEALLKAQIERFGQWHPSVGAATHNVAVVRLRMGQAKEAKDLFAQAVAIRRKVLGNEHLDLAASLAKLGSARVALQEFDDGLVVLREALSIGRKTLGRCNKTVAQILCHIACLYFEASELYSAQATFEDALEIYREVFPTAKDRDSVMAQLTETLCNIGSIQNKRKNFRAAIDCFREALDLQRGVMGHDHPRVLATLDNLGYSFSKQRMYHQALTCYKEMLTAQMSRHGCFSTECCETLKKQIIICEKMKNLDGAIEATKLALELVCQETPVPESSVTYEIEQILSDLKQKRSGISSRRCRCEF